jgi:hypothetical protein
MIKGYFPMKFTVCFSRYSYIIIAGLILSSCSAISKSGKNNITDKKYFNVDLDTVRAGQFDMGKMWTFDNPPAKYFKDAYNFEPGEEWFDNVRKSALRFSAYCSASFISGDGLIMTNYHCGRESVTDVDSIGGKLHEDGFFAETLRDERKVKGLYVDQLILIKDVTKDIMDAISSGSSDSDKTSLKNRKIEELENSYNEKTGLITSVVSFYNGSKYSIYGYKRYKDVRLVFAPENSLGFFGGDYDNFTYPRYCLDFTFFRVYDDSGKPLKTPNYFKWSSKGVVENQPVFVVGNPGSTNRLKTVAELEYLRDIEYPLKLNVYNGLIELYSGMIAKRPGNKEELQDKLYSFTNAQKVFKGTIDGLFNPVLMARKMDFEKRFRNAVDANPAFKQKYGGVWENIKNNIAQKRSISGKIEAYSINPSYTSDYFYIARDLLRFANQFELPADQRNGELKTQASTDSVIDAIFPADFDKEINDKLLVIHINNIINILGQDDELVKKMFDNKKGKDAADYILSRSLITTKEDVIKLAHKGAKAIINSQDPFIYFLEYSAEKLDGLYKKESVVTENEDKYDELLGEAVYDVYGTSIPPDATFTLRISDGIVKGYEYNGTLAPAKTTFFGMYNRFYSFNKQAPWDLPAKWQNPPSEFKLETPMNFVSTNDIVGGNSGSPVINENAEIVGVAFDGNMESLPGDFIFTTESNRAINVASEGIEEAVHDIYKAERLTEELRSGRIPEKYYQQQDSSSVNTK